MCAKLCVSVCVYRAAARQGENGLSIQLSSSAEKHGALPHLRSPAQQREEQDQTQQGIARHDGCLRGNIGSIDGVGVFGRTRHFTD